MQPLLLYQCYKIYELKSLDELNGRQATLVAQPLTVTRKTARPRCKILPLDHYPAEYSARVYPQTSCREKLVVAAVSTDTTQLDSLLAEAAGKQL